MAKPKPKPSAPKKSQEIEIHYIKTPQFRNIFVSGAYGGAAKEVGRVYMSLFSDRIPIPQTIVGIVENDSLVGEIAEKKVSKKGVIRDVEANLIFDLNTAKAMMTWLQSKIDVLEGRK